MFTNIQSLKLPQETITGVASGGIYSDLLIIGVFLIRMFEMLLYSGFQLYMQVHFYLIKNKHTSFKKNPAKLQVICVANTFAAM